MLVSSDGGMWFRLELQIKVVSQKIFVIWCRSLTPRRPLMQPSSSSNRGISGLPSDGEPRLMQHSDNLSGSSSAQQPPPLQDSTESCEWKVKFKTEIHPGARGWNIFPCRCHAEPTDEKYYPSCSISRWLHFVKACKRARCPLLLLSLTHWERADFSLSTLWGIRGHLSYRGQIIM